ncbi:MAG: hypothetical protein Unbinned3818contig1000_69 [Prokaryotic dsDNA virus sp.]|nr:MAG: hypothetical protein Unbinned3818contig1000_69 [Prokaryotic dsDNA virus sp.]|tara:strand:- start:236 stop:394 length:159 start_codon:yes stop_codon:yes gene_type:complete
MPHTFPPFAVSDEYHEWIEKKKKETKKSKAAIAREDLYSAMEKDKRKAKRKP